MKRKWESSKEKEPRLKGKVSKGGAEHKHERRRYLSELIEELEDAAINSQAKQQVLANLANFAYDPYNYEFFKELDVIHVFLEQLKSLNNDPQLIEYALGGICNCSADVALARIFKANGGFTLLKNQLSSPVVSPESIISAITTYLFVLKQDYKSKSEILCTDLITLVQQYAQSDDNRIKNVANIFLEDF